MDTLKHEPQLQEITNPKALITFKKKTKSIEYWTQHKSFEKTRLFEYLDTTKGLSPRGTIKAPTETHNIPSNRSNPLNMVYISNLEKRYISYEKFVMFGAILTYYPNILHDNPITLLTHYYNEHIPKHIRPKKAEPQTTITPANKHKKEKKTQERGSVIIQELFKLIDSHGTPAGLQVLLSEEDIQLLLGNQTQQKPSEEKLVPEESPKTPTRNRFTLSRKPSGKIPKISTKKPTTRNAPHDDKSS